MSATRSAPRPCASPRDANPVMRGSWYGMSAATRRFAGGIKKRRHLPPTRCGPPSTQSDSGPDCLDHAEGPGALQKPVCRAQHARHRKAQDEPGTARLQRIADQHRGYREKAEGGESVHQASRSRTGRRQACNDKGPFSTARRSRRCCSLPRAVRETLVNRTPMVNSGAWDRRS